MECNMVGQVRHFTLYVLNWLSLLFYRIDGSFYLTWLGVLVDLVPQQSLALKANYMMDQPNRSEASGPYAIYFDNEGVNLQVFSHAVLIHK